MKYKLLIGFRELEFQFRQCNVSVGGVKGMLFELSITRESSGTSSKVESEFSGSGVLFMWTGSLF